MDSRLVDFFALQVHTQCRFIIVAARHLNDAVGRVSAGPMPDGNAEVFAALQALLSAAANVSKACWGEGGRKAEERKALRQRLGISDASALGNTDVRNS